MRRGVLSIGIATVAAALVSAAPALAVPAVDGEFALPGASTVGANNEITAGPDGNMWVTTETNSVVRITPGGTTTAFPLVNAAVGITAGPDGNLWASQAAGVVRIDPATGTATEFAIAGYANGAGITTGPDGRVWVVGSNTLTSFAPADPVGTADVNGIGMANPKGMTTGSDGLLWFANGPNIVSATAAADPVLTPYPVGNSTGGTQDVGAGLNGQVAYANPVDDPQGVGLISPGGTPQKINLENSDPFGVAFGADGAYWVARSATNDLLRLTPDGATTTLTGFAPSGGVGPRKIAAGPNNTLWVTLDTPEKIARVTGVDPPATPVDPPPDPPVTPAVDVKITKGPARKIATNKRAKVKFKFVSSTAATTFECALKKKGKRNKAERKRAKFRPCTSPKKYKRLRLGKYKFRVRPMAFGFFGEPAKQRFKVVAK